LHNEYIHTCYDRIAGTAAAIAGSPDEWQPKHYTTVAPLYADVPSDMDISDALSSDMVGGLMLMCYVVI
jgi:hypothetical protein